MAQIVSVSLIDDIDETPADITARFAVNGTDYEIDLSSSNYAKFQASIAEYIECARKKGQNTKSSANGKAKSKKATVITEKPNSRDVREWARKVGIGVRDKGRIPRDIVEQYIHRNDPPMAGKNQPPITVTKTGPVAKKARNAGQKVGRSGKKKT